jgi:hypothetical protein
VTLLYPQLEAVHNVTLIILLLLFRSYSIHTLYPVSKCLQRIPNVSTLISEKSSSIINKPEITFLTCNQAHATSNVNHTFNNYKQILQAKGDSKEATN